MIIGYLSVLYFVCCIIGKRVCRYVTSGAIIGPSDKYSSIELEHKTAKVIIIFMYPICVNENDNLKCEKRELSVLTLTDGPPQLGRD